MEAQTIENPTNPNDFITIQQDNAIPPPPPPPSSVTSPSHEFSFNSTYTINCTETIPVDFSPAGDIFFDGQLLPLHPIVLPRLSTDIFIENLARLSVDSVSNLKYNTDKTTAENGSSIIETKERIKGKGNLASLLFGLVKMKKLFRGNSVRDHKDDADDKRSTKKKGIDMKRLLNRYLSLLEDIFFGFKKSKANRELQRMPYSFSGRSNAKNSEGRRRRKGHSTPISSKTSPSNSGLLSATTGPFLTTDDSTMEELKSAIQAAIAHCKNSVAVKEQLSKC